MGNSWAASESSISFSLQAVLSRQLFGEIVTLRNRCEVCLSDFDSDAVRQVRVSVRKLRGLIYAYRPLLKKGSRQLAEMQLKTIGNLFVEVREIDVFAKMIEERLTDLDLDDIPIAQDLLSALSINRAKVTEKLKHEQISRQVSELITELEFFVLNPKMKNSINKLGTKDQHKLLTRCIKNMWAELSTKVTETSRKSTLTEIHDLRIAAKYCRYVYALGCKYNILEARNRGVEHYAEGIQQILGAYLDAINFNTWLDTQTYLAPAERRLARNWVAHDLEFNFRELRRST